MGSRLLIKAVTQTKHLTLKQNKMQNARIFLTDYASYNNGTQFEFGHWVDLSDFSDASELMDYISEHFKQADEKSPLDEFGSTREEIMITDFEGFPKDFYSESMGEDDFENLYSFFEKCEACPYDYEVIEAFANLGNYDIEDVDKFFDALEESYQGEYSSDADFAQELAEELGYTNEKVFWPYTHIDWEWAARDLMIDYYESNGHYFRAI
ncbi:hypothetical protein AWW68_19410 [Roseivirga spongicola]|uniref:Antirestriction protein n=2 Tax=Roseivirga spongicola TaxID=333140 RepID=A0A150XCK2_9BACT|nr:hypothetical protein AWW68_19410 [Roseivirga spongicola]